MFKRVRIATGITVVVMTMTLLLIVVMAFSLFNAMSAKNNFTQMATSTENIRDMQEGVFNLNAGIAHVNGLMLQTSLDRPFSPDAVERLRGIFTAAQKSMKTFIDSPFNSDSEYQAAQALNAQFNKVLKLSQDKIQYIANPAAYPDNLLSESNERALLRQKIENYDEIAAANIQDYNRQAADDYYEMIAMVVVALGTAVVMTLLIRFWLRRALVLRMEQTSHSLKVIASGDLSQEIDVGVPNELGLMLVELEKMRLSLTETVSGVQHGVKRIYSNAKEIAQGNSDLSARTEEQASALQQTAASMEELKTTVRQNADNAHTARQLAESASVNARNGGKVMSNLHGIMQQITKSSRQIADINGVIDSIANQTNILALNAAVEAARAGEQGRGFAVVAGEVRNLAKRSADAAKEISQLITTCVDNMSIGSQQVDHAGTVMTDIVSSVTQVTDIMGEITSASDEQSAGINQIAQAVNEMDQVTQQNAVMVEEAAMAANNLEMHAEALEKITAKFVFNENAIHIEHDQKKSIKTPRLSSPVSIPKPMKGKNSQEENWETF